MSETKPTWDFPVANRCRHFKGIKSVTKACAAGMVYDDVARVQEYGRWGCALRLPCHNDTSGSPFTCRCLDRLTNDELEEEERRRNEAIAKLLENMPKAREAIIADVTARGALREKIAGSRRYRQGKDVAASIPCPICEGGTLHYSYCGSYNGHVHARCSTPGCMQWGE